ncbi:MAG: hypothetical protein HZA90_02190 [Verrucomicrobia bacterium]|nr:hypothetical protein [Verrucomicrobiota bacterium]
MTLATLTFSSPTWLWPAIVSLALAITAVLWSYRTAPPGGLRWVCAGLKALGIAALAFCLLEPLWSTQRARPGANLFALVADNSQGLRIKDRGAARTRGEQLKETLGQDNEGWQKALGEHFELRRFLFDARLAAARDFGELNFDGRSTAIGSALRGLRERFQGCPLAGVLFFTDGNATDLRDALPDLTGLPPVYPVVLGRAGAAQDVAVAQVQVSQTAFEDAPVTVQADVTATGFRGEKVVAQLLDASGKKIEERSLPAKKDDETLAFRFQWKPEKPGLSFYRVRVATQSEAAWQGATNQSREATLLNNSRIVPVDRGCGPYRILYVAGRPNWEYKFLNRAVQADDQVQLVGLIRIALREPKFDFRGRAGESGNPLFRGFGNQEREEVERYDQPVLVRQNTRDELELRAGFPRTPEDLYGYHAVILDDVEAAFFGPDQALLLQKFVSERGGGVLMLGGVESFQQGGYQRTPIGDMLPVYLDRGAEQKPAGPMKLSLAREGWLQAWARVRDNESDEKSRLGAMPPFQVFNQVREIKPGASIIATVADAQGKDFPALVTQRFGRGRTAAMMVGDFWRWGMRDADARTDMEKAWRQFVRWLVADVPKRVELTVEPPPPDAGEAMQLQVRVRDPKFQPQDDASVTIEVQPVMSETVGAATNVIRLRAEPSLTEAGVYQASYVPRQTGGYRATACVTNSAGAEVGRAEAGWSTDLAAEEFRSLQPNTALLEAIAKRTGGEVISADKLADFVRNLPSRQAPVMEPWTSPLWHTPLMFAFALACFAAEWGLRRWRGLP